jgi:predicted nuclease of restriction endonuclease-like (RecB) superfamily
MTPTFMGSEPVTATAGKYKGTAVLQREQTKGLVLINSLDEAQRKKAVLQTSKQGQNNLAEAFKDNVVLDDAGIRAADLSSAQKDTLLDVIQEHVGNLRDGHARVKMEEVRQHLEATHFAWIGETRANSVFYYRVQSPVILIEFDHQPPINMPGVERGKPTRQHIHSIVRTPNGNDYGKDLLRQHYQQHPHPH